MRVLLNSTNLSEVLYHPSTRTMELYFHSGHIYRYIGIPASIFQDLISAPSAGKFYNQHIRGQYSSLRWL
ncbi:MAG: KTSC domain-containing protein [Myxococcota bacterium]|nr:KTSC domain-containing protein [Myxococcota bacterium]